MSLRKTANPGGRGETTGVDVEFPEKLLPLMERLEPGGDPSLRKRYYVAFGGRGGAKSWNFARALLLQAMSDPLRILCAREIMRTIADSVHRLLSDQIAKLNMGFYYDVKDASITNKRGAEFLFTGLRQQDADKIKSFEAIDIAWVEEGQAVTKSSWGILIPTIRAEGSEIWCSFNPDLDTDDTYERFVVSPPENAWVQKIGWRDNPWFPAVLEAERLELQRRDPQEYRHVWEGEPRTVVEGAIYAREVLAMIESRRVRAVPYDPNLLVHTIWDLGWNDQTSIIFAQRLLSEVRIIDYEEESFLRYDEWAKILKDKPYNYGDHWLPHDGKHATQQGGGKSAQYQLKRFLPRDEVRVRTKPDTTEVPIRAARQLFPRVYMDAEKCGRLLACLKRFRRAVPETTGEPAAPVKDEYRHGADAFGGLARIVDKLTNEKEKPVPRTASFEPTDAGIGL